MPEAYRTHDDDQGYGVDEITGKIPPPKAVGRRVALPLTALVMLLLIAMRVGRLIPTELVLLTGAAFLLVSAVFWLLAGRSRARLRNRGALFQAGLLLLIWLLGLVALLGPIYTIDRAGWLWRRVTGYDTVLPENLSAKVDLAVADFLAQHNIFVADPENDGGLLLTVGVYDVDETILVPRGTSLRIEPGTELRFGAGRSLISYSPIIARGADGQPIRFRAQNRWLKWGAVGIVDAGPSLFEHTVFEDGREALVNDVAFFGALSVINAGVEISHSQFINLFGKDAVNVQYGEVLIHDNEFRDIRKDGLDLDGGGGVVRHNLFVNCGDEGIDLGENGPVEVEENIVLDDRGGRIGADNNLEEILRKNTVGYVHEIEPALTDER